MLVPDAQLGGQSAALGRVGSLAAAVLVLSTGLYALPLRAMAESYAVLPAGAPWPAGPAAQAWIAAGSALAFERGDIQLHQVLVVKPDQGRSGFPLRPSF